MVQSVLACHDVCSILLAWALVVTDGEVWLNVAADVGETAWAMLSVAGDFGGSLPNDLGEVAPLLEEGHIRVGLAVLAGKVWLLSIVKEVGDDSGDIGCLHSGSDILAIATTLGLAAKCK